MPAVTYGSISPGVAGWHSAELLKRAMPYIVLEKFAQTKKPLPANSTKTVIFSRYAALSNTPVALTEGVTPSGKTLTKQDISVTMKQFGDFVEITDQVMDMHDDPVLKETQMILGEQAGQMLEKDRYNTLKAGTNVYYANGTARNQVNTKVTETLIRRCRKGLKKQDAKEITEVLKSTPNYGAVSVKPAYITVGHTDLQTDLEALTGWKNIEDYGGAMGQIYEGEVGAFSTNRFILSTLFEPFPDAGAAAGVNFESTTGTNCDVYPLITMGRDAWACVPLKGKSAITPTVVNPNPAASDPLGQRGSAGWKAYHVAVILNDAWMVRKEVACTR
jgi:N4-gp56 family major capsid protein